MTRYCLKLSLSTNGMFLLACVFVSFSQSNKEILLYPFESRAYPGVFHAKFGNASLINLTTIHFVRPNWWLGRTYVLKEIKSRGTFWLVPTSRIYLSFVECVYQDLRDLLHNLRGLQWIRLQKMMALIESAISLPDRYILSLSKNENKFNEKDKTKQK